MNRKPLLTRISTALSIMIVILATIMAITDNLRWPVILCLVLVIIEQIISIYQKIRLDKRTTISDSLVEIIMASILLILCVGAALFILFS